MVRVFRLVLFVLATVFGASTNVESAEDASTPARGAGRLFALPSGSVSIEEALRVLAEEEEALRFTGTNPEQWHLDVATVTTEPEPESTNSFLGLSIEKKDDACFLLMHDLHDAPIAVRRNEHAFRLERPGVWRHVSHAPWRFLVDAGRFQCKDASDLPLGKSHEVQIDLCDCLTAAIRGKAEKAVWDARTRSLYLSKPDDATPIGVRFRSPDDQLRYGSVWRQVILPDGPNCIVVGSFVRQRMAFSMSASNVEAIVQAVDAAEVGAFSGDWSTEPAQTAERDAAALAMEATLVSEAYRRPETAVVREGIYAAYRAMLAYEKDKLDPKRDFAPVAPADAELAADAEKSTDVEERLRTTIFEAEMKFDAAEATSLVFLLTKTLGDLADAMANDLGTYPDDPTLIWHEAQMRYGAMRLHHFLRIFVSAVVFDDDGTPTRALRASLCDALLDLGEPPTMMFEARWTKLKKDPFLDVLLRAHQMQPTDEKHREACLAELQAAEAGSTLENLAVEVLLRIDALPLEETGAVERWWRSSVVEANRGRRLRSLVVLSGSTFGRQMILKRLDAEKLPDDVRQDVMRALASRIDAAEKTGRHEAIDAAQSEAWRKELAELDASGPTARR